MKMWKPDVPATDSKGEAVTKACPVDEENYFALRLDFEKIIVGGFFMRAIEIRDVTALLVWKAKEMSPYASVSVTSFNRRRYGKADWEDWSKLTVAWEEWDSERLYAHEGARGFLRAFWCMLQGLPPGKGYNRVKD